MDANERRGGMNIAHDERDGFLLAALGLSGRRVVCFGNRNAGEVAFKSVNAEFAPTGGKVGFR